MSSETDASSDPVTRAEFEALKAIVIEAADVMESALNLLQKDEAYDLRVAKTIKRTADLVKRLAQNQAVMKQRADLHGEITADLANLVDDMAHQVDVSPRTAQDIALRSWSLKPNEENGSTQ